MPTTKAQAFALHKVVIHTTNNKDNINKLKYTPNYPLVRGQDSHPSFPLQVDTECCLLSLNSTFHFPLSTFRQECASTPEPTRANIRNMV